MGQKGGIDVFVTGGFDTWSKKKSLKDHEGKVDSHHNKAKQKCENLVKKNESISEAFHKQTEVEAIDVSKDSKRDCSMLSKEIIKSICEEIGTYVFTILVDESSDVSKKEQMVMVLQYVNSLGLVKERFVGIVHMKDTTSLALKEAIDSVFTNNNLSISQLWWLMWCALLVKEKISYEIVTRKRVQKEIGNGEIEPEEG
ncbi:uncharacterized protein LOC111897931 [Lactuca sativa]|uniref:uncharacterized protein LOC111897931 n=1 Tax=Lactuca sativa TaxID=4236 RepID=UPI000CD8084C|nr:uncharacterized protein LOC111897931 [Lactuca sativa]